MATHPSILAWETPRTEEPGGLLSMGSERVRHDCVTKHACTLTSVHKRHLSISLPTYLFIYLLAPLSACLPPSLTPFQTTGEIKQPWKGT